MKIELSNKDIENAVKAHVEELGLPVEGKFVSIEFSTKRVGGAGLVAVVNIDDEAPMNNKEAVPAKARKPRGPNKAKATTEGAAGTVGGAIASQSTVTKEEAIAQANADANAAVNAQTIDPNAAALAAQKQDDAAINAVEATETAQPKTTTTSLFGE